MKALVISLIMVLLLVTVAVASDGLNYEQLYRDTDKDLQEALAIIKQYQAREKVKDDQIKRLIQDADDLKTASQAKDKIIADQQKRLDGLANQFGITGGLNTNGGYSIGIGRKWEYSSVGLNWTPDKNNVNLGFTFWF